MSNYNIEEVLKEYNIITQNEKVLKARKSELANLIKEFTEKNGVKNSNGSSYCENELFVYGRQAKKSMKINFEKAKNYLQENNLWDSVVELQETINESKLENLVADGFIPMDDFENIIDVKVTYAVDVKPKIVNEEEKEEMPTVTMVASKKKPRIIVKRK